MTTGELNTIIEFEVISPRHELETIGEILELSIFGEYCPIASLRGYQFGELLSHPGNYRPISIIEKGIEKKLDWLLIERESKLERIADGEV